LTLVTVLAAISRGVERTLGFGGPPSGMNFGVTRERREYYSRSGKKRLSKLTRPVWCEMANQPAA